MVNNQVISQVQRASLSVLLALLLVVVSVIMLELTALAGHRGKGAGCGGIGLLDGTEQNGDIVLVMVGSPWNTNGPIITKNLAFEGGWQVKSGENCDASIVYTDTSTFEFIGPSIRSLLTGFSVPVIEIDPSVLTLTMKHMEVTQFGTVTQGGGITGVISNGAHVLVENVVFSNDPFATVDDGAGLYLEVHGNSRLVISGSQFLTNTAQNTGGGFEIQVYDGSQVIINNTQVFGNKASDGNGGGGRILIDRGTVTIAGSTFSNNRAEQGEGGGLSVEAIGSGPAYLILQNTVISSNTAIPPGGDDNLHISGNVIVLDKQIFLPVVLK